MAITHFLPFHRLVDGFLQLLQQVDQLLIWSGPRGPAARGAPRAGPHPSSRGTIASSTRRMRLRHSASWRSYFQAVNQTVRTHLGPVLSISSRSIRSRLRLAAAPGAEDADGQRRVGLAQNALQRRAEVAEVEGVLFERVVGSSVR